MANYTTKSASDIKAGDIIETRVGDAMGPIKFGWRTVKSNAQESHRYMQHIELEDGVKIYRHSFKQVKVKDVN